MCTARLYSQEGRPICTQIVHRQGRDHQPFLASEPLHTLVLTQCRCVTDRPTDGFAV